MRFPFAFTSELTLLSKLTFTFVTLPPPPLAFTPVLSLFAFHSYLYGTPCFHIWTWLLSFTSVAVLQIIIVIIICCIPALTSILVPVPSHLCFSPCLHICDFPLPSNLRSFTCLHISVFPPCLHRFPPSLHMCFSLAFTSVTFPRLYIIFAFPLPSHLCSSLNLHICAFPLAFTSAFPLPSHLCFWFKKFFYSRRNKDTKNHYVLINKL